MKKRLRLLIPIVIIVCGVFAYHRVFKEKPVKDAVIVSGNIEVTQARLGFRVPGTLEKRLVNEGDTVIQGQILATLDARDQAVAVTRAEADVWYAQSVVNELSTGTRPQDIGRAKSELKRAKAASRAAEVSLNQAKSDFNRFEGLFKENGISQRQYEQYKAIYETAKSKHRQATAQVAKAREMLSLSQEGPRKESVDQAMARLKSAKAMLKQARLYLEYTELKAPMDGVILTKAAEVGEYLMPGSSVVVLGDLSRPWIRAYIHESDMGRVRLNNIVHVTVDTFPEKVFEGTVSFISNRAEFTPKSVQTFEERVKLMFRIKVELTNPDGYFKPGMPADARILCPVP